MLYTVVPRGIEFNLQLFESFFHYPLSLCAYGFNTVILNQSQIKKLKYWMEKLHFFV